jgi:L-histidine Nalpha-methyltransferase
VKALRRAKYAEDRRSNIEKASAWKKRRNDYEARIEMHLEAGRYVELTVPGQSFAIPEGETVHTENSFKYGPREARTLLRAGGWSPVADWTDTEGLFTLLLASSPSAVL